MFDKDGLPTPVLFPTTITHSEMAKCFNCPVLSAGFVTVVENHVEVFGRSDSLEVHCHQRDAKVIELFLRQDDSIRNIDHGT